jgi:hypothetical protein
MQIAFESLGVNESDFQLMVSQQHLRLQSVESEIQYSVLEAPVVVWPANLLVWTMTEIPEPLTTTLQASFGSKLGRLATLVALSPVFCLFGNVM